MKTDKQMSKQFETSRSPLTARGTVLHEQASKRAFVQPSSTVRGEEGVERERKKQREMGVNNKRTKYFTV